MKVVYPPKAKHSIVSQITKALTMGALALFLGYAGSTLWSTFRRNSEVPKEVTQYKSLEQLVETDFSFPAHLEIIDEHNNVPGKAVYSYSDHTQREVESVPENNHPKTYCPVAYILDAVPGIIHRFGCATPLHSAGDYIPPGPRLYIPPGKTAALQREYLEIFSPKRRNNSQVPFVVDKGHWEKWKEERNVNGSVDVDYYRYVEPQTLTLDNLDGSVTSYSLPRLQLLSRKPSQGGLPGPEDLTLSQVSQTIRPFRDDVYKEGGEFRYVFVIQSDKKERLERSISPAGLCNHLPVLAFSDQQQMAIYGYLCDNGDIETYQRFGYADLPLERDKHSRLRQPLSLDTYGSSIFIIQKGVPQVKVVTINPQRFGR